jgi:hypothetical protein
MAQPCARIVVGSGMMRLIRSCHRDGLFYTRQVRLSWKFLSLSLLTAVSLLTAGCGGISASKSVSPLDFLLPGIIKSDPATVPQNPVAPLPKTVQV